MIRFLSKHAESEFGAFTRGYFFGHPLVPQLGEALETLAQNAPRQAEIVKLRFSAGFNEPEIAKILNCSERSLQREWSYAKAWLFWSIEAMNAT